MNIECFSSLNDVSDEILKTKDQILVINKVEEKFNIFNYQLVSKFATCAYDFKVVGSFYDENNNLNAKTGTCHFIRIDNEFIPTSMSYLPQRIMMNQNGFSFERYSKTIDYNLVFDIEENTKVKLMIRFSFGKIITCEKSIHLCDYANNKKVAIRKELNLDKIFNYFLSLCNLNDKDKFVDILNISNYKIKDNILNSKNNNYDQYKLIKKEFVYNQKIITKKFLDKMLNSCFRLNDNVICYFPFILLYDSISSRIVEFTFVNNDGDIIDNYNRNDIENDVLNHLSTYYKNGYGKQSDLDPFTKKFNKKSYYIGYESSTGIVLCKGSKSTKNNVPNKIYLNYNNIYYETKNSKDNEQILNEYNMLKRLTN